MVFTLCYKVDKMTHKKISKKLDKKLNLDHYCMSFALIYKDNHVDIFWIHDIEKDIIEFNQSFNSIKDFNDEFLDILNETDSETSIIDYIDLDSIDENLIEIKQWYF